MIRALKRVGLLTVVLAPLLAPSGAGAEQPAAPGPLLKRGVDPKEFGIQDERITVIHSSAFTADDCGSDFSVYLGRFEAQNPICDTHYYASLDLPAGAVIDFIGLNTANDTDIVFGFELWRRNNDGSTSPLTSFSVPAHDWDTDFVGPLGIQIPDHIDHELILDVENAGNANNEYFGWVEVHWHRTVSPPPAVASFFDVPPTSPFFQYVEAIHAAGITAGCGGGNFCPDQTITRKQEAAFIAKALGLHWPE